MSYARILRNRAPADPIRPVPSSISEDGSGVDAGGVNGVPGSGEPFAVVVNSKNTFEIVVSAVTPLARMVNVPVPRM